MNKTVLKKGNGLMIFFLTVKRIDFNKKTMYEYYFEINSGCGVNEKLSLIIKPVKNNQT